MFKNASNKRGHLVKTFNPFLPLAVQPQGAQRAMEVTPGSCRGMFASCMDPLLCWPEPGAAASPMDLALVAASPITTGRKIIHALIAIVTLLKL